MVATDTSSAGHHSHLAEWDLLRPRAWSPDHTERYQVLHVDRRSGSVAGYDTRTSRAFVSHPEPPDLLPLEWRDAFVAAFPPTAAFGNSTGSQRCSALRVEPHPVSAFGWEEVRDLSDVDLSQTGELRAWEWTVRSRATHPHEARKLFFRPHRLPGEWWCECRVRSRTDQWRHAAVFVADDRSASVAENEGRVCSPRWETPGSPGHFKPRSADGEGTATASDRHTTWIGAAGEDRLRSSATRTARTMMRRTARGHCDALGRMLGSAGSFFVMHSEDAQKKGESCVRKAQRVLRSAHWEEVGRQVPEITDGPPDRSRGGVLVDAKEAVRMVHTVEEIADFVRSAVVSLSQAAGLSVPVEVLWQAHDHWRQNWTAWWPEFTVGKQRRSLQWRKKAAAGEGPLHPGLVRLQSGLRNRILDLDPGDGSPLRLPVREPRPMLPALFLTATEANLVQRVLGTRSVSTTPETSNVTAAALAVSKYAVIQLESAWRRMWSGSRMGVCARRVLSRDPADHAARSLHDLDLERGDRATHRLADLALEDLRKAHRSVGPSRPVGGSSRYWDRRGDAAVESAMDAAMSTLRWATAVAQDWNDAVMALREMGALFRKKRAVEMGSKEAMVVVMTELWCCAAEHALDRSWWGRCRSFPTAN